MSQAIDGDQRFVQLAEEQALAVVRRARRVGWIDAIAEANRGNGFTRRRDERAGIGFNRGRRRLRRAIGFRHGNHHRGRMCTARRDRLKADDEAECGQSLEHLHSCGPVAMIAAIEGPQNLSTSNIVFDDKR